MLNESSLHSASVLPNPVVPSLLLGLLRLNALIPVKHLKQTVVHGKCSTVLLAVLLLSYLTSWQHLIQLTIDLFLLASMTSQSPSLSLT